MLISFICRLVLEMKRVKENVFDSKEMVDWIIGDRRPFKSVQRVH